MPALSLPFHPDDPLVDEPELVTRASQDPVAFASLYRRYLDRVYHYIFSRVVNRFDAEDLTAQVFLDVLEGLPGYQEQGCFPAWIFAIARRRLADYYRQRQPSPLDPLAPPPDPDPLAEVMHTEDLGRLRHLVARLGEEEQELLRLRFAAGLRFHEIAALTCRKESAVKMAFYRLLQRLQAQIEACHE